MTIGYDGDGSRVTKTVAGVTTKYMVDTDNLTGYAQVLEERNSAGGVLKGLYLRARSTGVPRPLLMKGCVSGHREIGVAMKLAEALIREHWKAYRVSEESVDDWDDFENWELQPLSGATLAEEDIKEGVFQLFIVAAQLVSEGAPPQPCYLDLAMPERISEHHFVKDNGRIVRRRGRRTENGTVIPSIGIEKLGVYTLFLAKENPSAGIDILKSGIAKAHHKEYLAYDLALLLRDEKRYEEAIDAFTVVITEGQSMEMLPIRHTFYRERSQLYAKIGQLEKADADRRLYADAFEKNYGHAPGPHEM